MPHDVTMPQLGMAQDAGKIVSWLKAPGEPVTKGDALFEVETDKATMEVEAQASGFLTGVSASEGEDVKVGAVIARISDSADDEGPAPEAPGPAVPEDTSDALPEGKSVTMPQLGMAQDSGLLVSWQKTPGDVVKADDVLFEVETDKSTMEVEAGTDGYLAATLAEAGENVPVGQAVAIISAEKPDALVRRSVASGGGAAKAAPAAEPEPTKVQPAAPKPAATKPAVQSSDGRILASPKLRRLAQEQGLDLSRLVEAGHPQPYHVRDLEVLKALPQKSAQATATAAAAAHHLVAKTSGDALPGFARWAAEAHGLADADALVAALAGASLPDIQTVSIERLGTSTTYATPDGCTLSEVTQTDDAPDLILRDLRGTTIRSAGMGTDVVPTITITQRRKGLKLTLDCAADQLDAQAAIQLLTNFAGRVEQPLRHLL
ncbi:MULTISPECIES: biotin/lipoyl-containing protein [Marivita]|uniref:Pyruvate dehydrogenase n=1 Tax=Marivita cryptomonadis TaxID=505252 RepID=A0A9Q2S767_9RHOB|nr:MULTISPECIES: biotin/lipoyl-containing protein [Marivita]MCR9168553.1 pyruvate dehydrogenase [Paracoccaceae bacterium]MBM2323878.1 pyruvate dehydrogenase [Marivita cryptomonadis]MBM2333467.1 pyruvate dehydrogenase [Marivita cryptomonadis]MBM2343045.1 pyruvate dehydrogenase [Marivita cryptomonadis]MBM2347716.1 pyruvate dehydrogenase [Marivita cryptomonadis]